MTLSRRSLLRLGLWGSVGAVVGTFGYTWRIEPHWIEEVRRALPITGLPGRWQGRTLVQISDLHIGPVVDDGYMSAALERVAALRPDVLAITGDFMTCLAGEEIDKTLGMVEKYLRPRQQPTVAVLGNHDFGAGWHLPAVGAELAVGLDEIGITVLRNEAVTIDGLTIAGVDDLWGGMFMPAQVVPTLGPASLVLCHNPDAVDRPGWGDYRGWILSGHTHGGQCKPPFLEPPHLPIFNRRYAAGAIDLGDGRHLYVNRALGYIKRVRFNVRPEITVFTLTQPSTPAA